MSSPAWTGSKASVLVIWRSAEGGGSTAVWALAWLLPTFASAVVEDTVAVLVTPGSAVCPAVATIVTVTSFAAPALTVPRTQLTVLVPEQVPWVDDAETSVRPAGSGSDSDTAAAGLGPALWTASV